MWDEEIEEYRRKRDAKNAEDEVRVDAIVMRCAWHRRPKVNPKPAPKAELLARLGDGEWRGICRACVSQRAVTFLEFKEFGA